MFIIRGLFGSAKVSGHLINSHPPASKIDMDEICDVTKKLSPTVDNQPKIDSININKIPDIQKALNNH
jgi:hypothetical protein